MPSTRPKYSSSLHHVTNASTGNTESKRLNDRPDHSNEKHPSPTIIAIPAVKIRGDHIPQGLAATCAEEIGADDTLDPGANVTLELFIPREDGTPADVELEYFFAAVVACIVVCCTLLVRPPLIVAAA